LNALTDTISTTLIFSHSKIMWGSKMALASRDTRQQAHELIDRMAPGQVSAVVGLLEIILDPVARSLASAPYEDEEISEEENLAVAASKSWLENNKPISNEDVLAEFGLSTEDFERMAHTPLEHHIPGQ
jgi:hypothetical protein